MRGHGVHQHRAGGIITLVFSIADSLEGIRASSSRYAPTNDKALLPSINPHSFTLFFMIRLEKNYYSIRLAHHGNRI
jgi:hypothetical protein